MPPSTYGSRHAQAYKKLIAAEKAVAALKLGQELPTVHFAYYRLLINALFDARGYLTKISPGIHDGKAAR